MKVEAVTGKTGPSASQIANESEMNRSLRVVGGQSRDSRRRWDRGRAEAYCSMFITMLSGPRARNCSDGTS